MRPLSLFPLIVLTGLTNSALAQKPVPMSVADALARARAVSPQLRSVGLLAESAEEKARAAERPTAAQLTLARGIGSGTGGLDEDILLGVPIELASRRRPRVALARSEAAAARARREAAAVELDYVVRSAYIEALRTEAELGLAAAQQESAAALVTAAESQLQAGDIPRSQVERARIERARAEQAALSARAERDNRLSALKSLTGLVPDESPAPTGALSTPEDPVQSAAPLDLPALIQKALDSRPELREARATADSRRADLAAARAQRRPDLLVEGRRASLDPGISGSSVRLGVTLPLFDYGRIAADGRAASRAVDAQSAALLEAERAARLDVETAWRTLEAARSVAASFPAERLTRAKTVLDLAQLGYERGASSFLELLDARQVFRTEQIEYARARAAAALALAALQRAVGGELP